MAKKRFDKRERLRQIAEYADRWLMTRQRNHIASIEIAIKELERSIIDNLNRLLTTEGRLDTPKINFKIAQKIHREIFNDFSSQFDPVVRAQIADFDNLLGMVERSYANFDEVLNFTSVDRKALNALKHGYLNKWIDLSGTKRNEVTQAMYNHVIGRQKFSRLVEVVQKNIYGADIPGVPGKSLAQQARLYARDMLMNFHNETIVTASENLDMNHFLYIGDIMSTTRDFCRKRAGRVYTRKQIDSWTYKWAGKSGPAMTHRGGYNCRHHWQPMRPEWLDGEKRVDIANWDLETREGG